MSDALLFESMKIDDKDLRRRIEGEKPPATTPNTYGSKRDWLTAYKTSTGPTADASRLLLEAAQKASAYIDQGAQCATENSDLGTVTLEKEEEHQDVVIGDAPSPKVIDRVAQRASLRALDAERELEEEALLQNYAMTLDEQCESSGEVEVVEPVEDPFHGLFGDRFARAVDTEMQRTGVPKELRESLLAVEQIAESTALVLVPLLLTCVALTGSPVADVVSGRVDATDPSDQLEADMRGALKLGSGGAFNKKLMRFHAAQRSMPRGLNFKPLLLMMAASGVHQQSTIERDDGLLVLTRVLPFYEKRARLALNSLMASEECVQMNVAFGDICTDARTYLSRFKSVLPPREDNVSVHTLMCEALPAEVIGLQRCSKKRKIAVPAEAGAKFVYHCTGDTIECSQRDIFVGLNTHKNVVVAPNRNLHTLLRLRRAVLGSLSLSQKMFLNVFSASTSTNDTFQLPRMIAAALDSFAAMSDKDSLSRRVQSGLQTSLDAIRCSLKKNAQIIPLAHVLFGFLRPELELFSTNEPPLRIDTRKVINKAGSAVGHGKQALVLAPNELPAELTLAYTTACDTLIRCLFDIYCEAIGFKLDSDEVEFFETRRRMFQESEKAVAALQELVDSAETQARALRSPQVQALVGCAIALFVQRPL